MHDVSKQGRGVGGAGVRAEKACHKALEAEQAQNGMLRLIVEDRDSAGESERIGMRAANVGLRGGVKTRGI